jgi:hypothetical protein
MPVWELEICLIERHCNVKYLPFYLSLLQQNIFDSIVPSLPSCVGCGWGDDHLVTVPDQDPHRVVPTAVVRDHGVGVDCKSEDPNVMQATIQDFEATFEQRYGRKMTHEELSMLKTAKEIVKRELGAEKLRKKAA